MKLRVIKPLKNAKQEMKINNLQLAILVACHVHEMTDRIHCRCRGISVSKPTKVSGIMTLYVQHYVRSQYKYLGYYDTWLGRLYRYIVRKSKSKKDIIITVSGDITEVKGEFDQSGRIITTLPKDLFFKMIL